MHGNKCTLRKPDGTTASDAHVEDLILTPDPVRNLEDTREPWHLPEDQAYGVLNPLDSLDVRRSPGEMLEDDGKLRDAVKTAEPL